MTDEEIDKFIEQVSESGSGRVVRRSEVPDWYLRINDMVAQSPLMMVLSHHAETGEKKNFGKIRWCKDD